MGHPDWWWGAWWGGLIAAVLVELYAVVDVVDGAVFHGGVGVDGLGALAIELEPGEAAIDVFDMAILRIGVEGDELLEVVESGAEGGGGIVAEGGGVVEGGPGGRVEARRGDDNRCGSVVGGGEVPLVAAMADDVEDEEAEDYGEENVVAGTEVHRCQFSVFSCQFSVVS
jgi:hypothetical protein